MSGHSKWHSIKHKKAKVDAAKGKIFTRLIKEITVSARSGGGNPEMNPRLRTAIYAAKNANMPSKNIENAIKKGTGELPGVVYEEVIYEGYGPGGVALYIVSLTENKNRTVAEFRHVLNRYGGNLGETGCVAWIFEKKGLIKISKKRFDEESVFMAAIDAGAEDMRTNDEEFFEIYTSGENLDQVRESLERKNITASSAEKTIIPQNIVKLNGKNAEQTLKIMEVLDDHEDVQAIYANFDIDDEVMEKIAG
jgi:YebC/PmpR family DNA-binding regulatory protein